MSALVLAAIDLSHPEHHDKILTKAARMAAMDEALLAVVTVIPDFGMSVVGSYFEAGAEQKALDAAATTLHQTVSTVLGADADPGIKHVVRHGSAYQEILETAKDLGATLIVMGAHRPEFTDYLIGPNAARVVRHSNCSVFVLRD